MKGFGKAVLSTSIRAVLKGYVFRGADPTYWANRVSEQSQIELYRKLGISGNDINGLDIGKQSSWDKFAQAAKDLLE